MVRVKGDSWETLKTKRVRTESLQVGDALTCGGYNWHVIRNYEEDGTIYQTLLMEAGQLENMNHCTMLEQTNCQKSTIVYYLYDSNN